jgi:hypothetical protein
VNRGNGPCSSVRHEHRDAVRHSYDETHEWIIADRHVSLGPVFV